MRIIVTCMKNEGPFVLEWIAFHLSIGFDKYLIYTNDCDDGTDHMAARLEELGLCEHLENPKIGNQRPQAVALRDMMKRPIVTDAEWIFFSDCDEFLNIHVGDGHLNDLIAAMGDASIISPMWRLFGDSGIADFSDQPVIEQFVRAAPAARPVSVNSWGFKSLFKPGDNIERVGTHRPFFKDIDKVRGAWLSSNGEQMPEHLLERGWRFTRGNGGYAWAQLNHYAVRSVDSFLVKSHRGHVLHTHKEIDLGYHQGMNQNHVEDRTILRRLAPFHARLSALKQDPVLSKLHADAVSAHHARAQELRHQYTDLYRELAPNSGRE